MNRLYPLSLGPDRESGGAPSIPISYSLQAAYRDTAKTGIEALARAKKNVRH
jgi:hypothetical protein